MKNARVTEKNKALTLNIASTTAARRDRGRVAQLVADKVPANNRRKGAARSSVSPNCRPGLGHSHFGGTISNSCSGDAYRIGLHDVLWPTFAARTSSSRGGVQQREDASGVSTNDHDQDDVVVGVLITRSCGVYAAVTPCCSRAPHSGVLASWSASVCLQRSWHRTRKQHFETGPTRPSSEEIRDDPVLRTYKSGESIGGRALDAIRQGARPPKGIRKTTSRLGGN